MKSRVHPKYKTKYRVGNWAEYDRALVRRGDITLWISSGATEAWTPAPSGTRGGQRKFSDVAIETALTLRLILHLPLRQAEGFLRSVLSLMGLDLETPDHTTLSRRSQRLEVALHRTRTKEPIHLYWSNDFRAALRGSEASLRQSVTVSSPSASDGLPRRTECQLEAPRSLSR